MNSGIYIIKNTINGKFYIGSAVNIKTRWSQHRHQLKHNKHGNRYLQRSWNKHGTENFVFEVLEYVKDNSIIGLGTGSTANIFIEMLAEKIRSRSLNISVVASSVSS